MPVLDKDEIDLHRYTAKEPAPVQTPLGCFDAVEVVRLREDSDRYSSVWLAPALDWISVRVVHGKQDGREFVMQIDALTLEGEAVEGKENCE